MNWRIYRLPGSRETWHIDSGAGTQIFNVRGFRACRSKSIDIGGNNSPRAWIEVSGDFHVIDGIAFFAVCKACNKREIVSCAAVLE